MRRWNKQFCGNKYYLSIILIVCLLVTAGCGAGGGTVISLKSESGAVSDSSEAQNDTDSGRTSGEQNNTEAEKTSELSEDKETKAVETENDSETGQSQDSGSGICIYICGAVRNPGVYQLPAGSRVYQAVTAAGGLTEAADLKSLNQASELEDGQQITVYTAEEAEAAGLHDNIAQADGVSAGGTNGSGEKASAKVNLNTAGKEELMTLPGIGEARADAIIRYREETGRFQQIEDIQNIEGIKEKMFAKLQDKIEV